jgi:hypothetical protein
LSREIEQDSLDETSPIMKSVLKKSKSKLEIDRSPLSATETGILEIVKKKRQANRAEKSVQNSKG